MFADASQIALNYPASRAILLAHAENRLCGIRVLLPLSTRFSCLATI